LGHYKDVSIRTGRMHSHKPCGTRYIQFLSVNYVTIG